MESKDWSEPERIEWSMRARLLALACGWLRDARDAIAVGDRHRAVHALLQAGIRIGNADAYPDPKFMSWVRVMRYAKVIGHKFADPEAAVPAHECSDCHVGDSRKP